MRVWSGVYGGGGGLAVGGGHTGTRASHCSTGLWRLVLEKLKKFVALTQAAGGINITIW
jgi:hypothetical protein